MTRTELMQQIIQKQDEYIKILELHTRRYDLCNPVHTSIRAELSNLVEQLEESEESCDNCKYTLVNYRRPPCNDCLGDKWEPIK